MNSKSITALIVALMTIPATGEVIFPWNTFQTGEKGYRRTIEEAFPNLKFGFYHFAGDVIIGLLEDFDHDRVMLLSPPLGGPVVKITRNGKDQKLPEKNVTIKVAGQLHKVLGEIEDDPETAVDHHIGYWIELEATERFSITLTPFSPVKGSFQADYSPDSGWRTSCTVHTEFEPKDPADAYEVSRKPLLKQIIGILEKKNQCVVRLVSGRDQIVRKWDETIGAGMVPMSVTIGDEIVFCTGQGSEVVTAARFSEGLQSLRAAARASDRLLRIRINAQKDGDDALFRLLIQEVSQVPFAEAYIDSEKPVTPREKRLPLLPPVAPRDQPRPGSPGAGQPAAKPADLVPAEAQPTTRVEGQP